MPSTLPLLNLHIAIALSLLLGIGVAAVLIGSLILRQLPVLLNRFGLGDLRVAWKPLFSALLLSTVGHFIYASAYILLFSSLAQVNYAQVLALTLLALLTRSVPISFLGVEVSDGSLVMLGSLIEMSSDPSLSVVVLVLSSRYMVALIGFVREISTDGIECWANADQRKPAA